MIDGYTHLSQELLLGGELVEASVQAGQPGELGHLGSRDGHVETVVGGRSLGVEFGR
jgi:hypothetical protein